MTTTWSRPQSEILGLSAQSQKDRMRDLLRSSGPAGLCSLMVYAVHLPNGRTRCYELRDDDGLDIETIGCDLARFHAGEQHVPGHVRWVWHWNNRPRQLALLRAI
jgi:hypothetical protein